MSRIFIDRDEARITVGSSYTVNVEFYSGEKYENLEVRSLFPISSPEKYISLVKDGKEIAVIRNLSAIMEESQRSIREVMENYYMIPKIKRVLDRSEKYGVLRWTADTDKGERSFEIKNRSHDIRLIYGKRVLIKDSNDNRYEIEDIDRLDYKSVKLISNDL